jgi:hypothetical protein
MIRKLNTTPYPIQLYLCVCKQEKCIQWLKEKHDRHVDLLPDKVLGAVHWWDYDNFIAIWIPRFKYNDIDDLVNLEHECGHAAMQILTTIHANFQPINDEIRSYLTSHIFRQCLRLGRKQ